MTLNLAKYTKDKKDFTQGNRGKKVGVASCVIWARLAFVTNVHGENDGMGRKHYWKLGDVDGDAPTIDTMLKTYVNASMMITKTQGNQKTGNDPIKPVFKLKNLTLWGETRCNNSEFDPTVAFTSAAGTRKWVITFSGAFTADGVIDLDFTTTNIETEATETETISVNWTTDDPGTKAAVLAAVKNNVGINQTTTVWASHVLTIYTKAGYYLTVVTEPTVTGGTPPTISSSVQTDTSIVQTTIDTSNSYSVANPTTHALSRLILPLASGGGAELQRAVSNAPAGALPELYILTGDSEISRYENPLLERVDTTNDIAYLVNALDQLPLTGAAVKVIAHWEDYPGAGDNLPGDLEVLLEFRDHSNKTNDLIYIPCLSTSEDTKAANYTSDGKKGQIGGVIIEQLFTINGDEVLAPCRHRRVNSAVGVH
jgi:hypothetical protein